MTRFDPGGPLRGTLAPPPDKSISHRAAILAGFAEGETRIDRNFLLSADTAASANAVLQLGAEVEELERRDGAATMSITGVGLRRRRAGRDQRPQRRHADAPAARAARRPAGGRMDPRRRRLDPQAPGGARSRSRCGRWAPRSSARDGLPPLTVRAAPLRGIEYRLPVASAQVKSCVLFAGLNADGATSVIEQRPTRDHTERMLRAAGATVRTENAGTPVTIHGELPATRVTVEPAERLELGSISVPGDFSSAAFFIVAALLVRGSEVRLEGVGINPGRIGLLGILTRMGAAVEVIESHGGDEPTATVVARSGPLQGTRVGGGEVPLAIDELPLVALAACFADGETVVTGAEELRHKESDRIATVVDGLSGLGADDRGDRGRLRRRGRRGAARRRARFRRRSPPRDARRGRRGRLGRGRRGPRDGGGGGQLPGLRGRSRRAERRLSLSSAATDVPRRATARAPTAAARPRSP